jgi:NAD(P)-dependent dehydrogenase (short-subunit alcohol dehydrogenase family)
MTGSAETTVLIAGAAMGIGREIALCFAQKGAAIAITDVDVPWLEQTRLEARTFTSHVLAITADVSNLDDSERIVRETHSHFGRLHIVVNNAAATRLNKGVQDMSDEGWDSCIDTTLRSVFLVSKWSATIIRDSGGGAIINLSSVGQPHPGLAVRPIARRRRESRH